MIAAVTSLPVASRAEPEVGGVVAPAQHVVSIGIKGGVGFPQVSSEFGTTPVVQVEVGYLLPILRGRLGILTGLGYSAPSVSGSGEDPRLPGGEYSYEATQRQLSWELGVQGRWKPWDHRWNATVAAGLNLCFQSTVSDGVAGGEPFGEHDERATLAGLFLAVQGDYRLGPGSVVGQAGYVASSQDLRTTGEFLLSEITILLGYRMWFGL